MFKTGVDSWGEMHKVLGTDRTSITSVAKDYADPVRHGNWIEARPTDKVIRFRMLELTRDILTKYLDHEQPTIIQALRGGPVKSLCALSGRSRAGLGTLIRGGIL